MATIFHRIAHYEKALLKHPENPSLYYNLGCLYYELQNQENARYYFRQALTIDPNDADCHINLAAVLKELSETGNARDHYLNACRIKPELRSQVHDALFGVSLN